MAGMYGNNVAKTVRNGIARVGPGAWTRLTANAITAVTATPLENRQWIRIQHRGTGGLAIAYSNVNADGTFTAPTYSAQGAIVIPAGSMLQEPLGSSVMMWGRWTNKINTSDGGTKVIVTEYA